jgi:mono/diheme cytochrome c family protein
MALDAHIEKQHIPPSPVPADEPNFLAGAGVYKQHCAVCHGLPGQIPVDYATTMFPKPPQLFRGKGVTDDPIILLRRNPTGQQLYQSMHVGE